MKSSNVLRAISSLKAAYPRQQIERATLEIYVESLADIADDALARAVNRLIGTSKWFPTIAEIREEVAREGLAGYPDPQLAWEEVRGELGRVGHTAPPMFSCEEIRQAVRAIGGWEYLCLAERNPYDRKAFIEAYSVALERTKRAVQLGQYAIPELAGGTEQKLLRDGAE